jgi:hypothetical protein
MTKTKIQIVDHKSDEIKVGTKVEYGVDVDNIATVIEITDPDGDYSDELQRAVEIPPHITIKFDDDGVEEVISTTNITRITWADYPDGPELLIYEADDDIEVITNVNKEST